MSQISHVVEGEASESDSDVEIAKSPDPIVSPGDKAYVVAGEAPESDDESKLQSPVKDELDRPLHLPLSEPIPKVSLYDSLLHQKLWESNVRLRATLEGLLKHTIDISVEKLTVADKTLLSVQESMRATNANLTLSKARLKQIHTELEKANCGAALSSVKITK